MKNTHSSLEEAFCSYRTVDQPSQPGGQFIEMDFMASNSYKSACAGRLRQKSLDSQEFGFASNLPNSTEVAPADELFFRGQLLPLQSDHRLNLVQALSECGQGYRGGPSGRPSDLSEDKEVIELRMKDHVELDSMRNSENPHPHSIISWCRDDEIITFNSCRMEGDYLGTSYKGNMNIDALMDLRSSSFRSQNSGFWESGADKDTTGDSSSSSRDSNGSSQDSYFPNHHTTNLPTTPLPSHHHHPPQYSKISFIPWKSLFKKAPKKQPPPSISKVGYSELDLSKYKAFPTPTSLNEVKEALKLDSESSKGGRKGEHRISSINDGSQNGPKIKPIVRDATRGEEVKAGARRSSTCSDGSKKGSKSAIHDDAEKEEMKKKQYSRSALDVKEERWQGYARRLKPLYEMKRGIMGQFRMDECGRKACEVESGSTIYASRSAGIYVQRRLSHQSSCVFKTHKISIQQKNQAKLCPNNMQNMLAMSSCPPSSASSPTHITSGAVQKGTTLQAPNCRTKTSGDHISNSNTNRNTNISGINISNSNTKKICNASNYTSISTMHELHSALQSAIAHCKESNKKLNFPA